MYQILCGHVNYALGKTRMQVKNTKRHFIFGFMFILISSKEEEVDSDDMEYTEDAIDNMILEF
jgi:hypothetical protein